ncbi:MAG: hypothetical protein ACJA0X_002380 [Cyclobacteriaceae bacterium]|jgi:hypothetical protein
MLTIMRCFRNLHHAHATIQMFFTKHHFAYYLMPTTQVCSERESNIAEQ